MSKEGDHQLPACQKCRLRKVKCDKQAPKCSNCTKANVACIVVDPATGEQYARDYIRHLEEKERCLRLGLGDVDDRGAPSTSALTETSDAVDAPSTGPSTVTSLGAQNGFVGHGSGLGFLQNILSDTKWQPHRGQILEQLARRPRIARHQAVPNALPPLAQAQQLLDNYFARFHVHHAILLRCEMLDIFSRVYSMSPSAGVCAQDFFRLFMVFAISDTTRHRASQGADVNANHPYGYYLAAENYLANTPLIKDPDAIQNLLLVARFGMYHHIGASIWEISRLCMRQCIEWGLHLGAQKGLNPLKEQHQRRIFWECYVHDRYSSGILGRPFAILESEITMPLPIDAGDETIITSGAAGLENVPITTNTHPSELSVNLFCIKLRRISSRIHSAFYNGRKPASYSTLDGSRTPDFRSIGNVYSSFSQFHGELDALRMSAPVFSAPSCLYERSEWHDFMYEKDRLLLARGAMHNIPARQFSGASILNEIPRACYQSATRVIELYADLQNKKAITWTRSYFQVIFTAGLTIIYCAILDVLNEQRGYPGMDMKTLHALDTCSSLLDYFKEKMPDAASFSTVFSVIKADCVKDCFAPLPWAPSMSSYFAPNNRQQPPDDTLEPQLDQRYPSIVDSPQHSVDATRGRYLLPTDQQLQRINRHHPSPYDSTGIPSAQPPQDFGISLADNIMNQLESGLGEYAWGSLDTEINLWNMFEND